MVFGCDNYVFHLGIFGNPDPPLGIESDRIKLAGEFLA